MASFQRQLNLYGFQRLTRGRDKNGYYNEYFLRGKPALAHNITRTKVKGTGVRARSNPNEEPHLWEMSWVGTDHDGVAHANYSGETEEHNSPRKLKDPPALKAAPVVPSSSNSNNCMPLVAPQLASCTAVSSWQQQLMQQQKAMIPEQQQQEDEGDVVLSFGGKRFHYLDPFEMMQEAQLRKKQYEACQQDDMQAFVSNLQLDSLCGHLDDQIMDDDESFIAMLERVIE